MTDWEEAPGGAPDLLRVVKRPIPVQVRFAPELGTVQTLEGPVQHEAGDAILTGPRGEQWPVARARFLASYDPIPPTPPGADGPYLKRSATVLACRLTAPVTVPVGPAADTLQGRPGDWLLRYADGALGVVRDDIFRETYGPA